ncbi:MAG: LytTR family DNA-binding domain-containing protein [Muribaculaceae bacterium]|nr:LytTR family DNA-binding domain-containing protein [Muribaculaceae bacterium]
MINCLVVDDEPLAARLISTYVERTPFLSLVAEVHNAEEAMAQLEESDVDLLFLDIRMPRLSGMQLARLLPKGIKTVFTTAYADHAVEGFRVGALDYLLKPVSYDDFMASAIRARDAIELERRTEAPAEVRTTRSNFLMVKSEYRLLRLPVESIIYVEGLKDYVKIFMADEPNPVLSLMSMKAVEEALPRPTFVRVHRSFIVNTDKVRMIERNCIVMNDRTIPVSENYRRRFFSALEGEG